VLCSVIDEMSFSAFSSWCA